MKAPVETYWVVGAATNVGKTTIAAALIRALNRRGQPTVGFKPFAGVRLKDSVDFMLENFPGSKCAPFGGDALKLCRASPLTDDSLVDVVSPWHLLFRNNIMETILIRIGSTALDNREFFKTALGDTLMERPDIRRLAQRTRLPMESARLFDEQAVPRASLAPGKVGGAFDHLVSLGPAAVVCEGAGHFLPLWPGHPGANHVFLVTDDTVFFWRDANVHLSLRVETPSTIEELAPVLGGIAKRAVPFPIVESARREKVADSMVDVLLG